MNPIHEHIRRTIRWASYGKPGAPDYGTHRWIIIKDIHDDHLENIIPFIRERLHFYSLDTLNMMIDEQEYRRINKIKVPFTFG